MKLSYDFLPPEEREWVERQSLAVVVLLVALALFTGFAFAQDSNFSGADVQAAAAAPAAWGAI